MLLLGIVCTTQRTLSEPFHQLGHHLLKAGRHVDANEPALVLPVILEVMRHSTWNQNVATTLSLTLLAVNHKAEGACEHIEDVVVGMGVSAWPLSSRLKPPLRDRVPRSGFLSVCKEDRSHPAHVVPAALVRPDD